MVVVLAGEVLVLFDVGGYIVIDVLLIDIGMFGMDGYGLVWILCEDIGVDVQVLFVVVVMVLVCVDDCKWVLVFGFQEYVVKFYLVVQLVLVVWMVLVVCQLCCWVVYVWFGILGCCSLENVMFCFVFVVYIDFVDIVVLEVLLLQLCGQIQVELIFVDGCCLFGMVVVQFIVQQYCDVVENEGSNGQLCLDDLDVLVQQYFVWLDSIVVVCQLLLCE